MPTARGFVKCDGNSFTGAFYVDGDPYHLAAEVEPPNESFECSNATLMYSTVDQLVGTCTWSGTVNQTNLRLRLGGGVSIAGSLDARRAASVLVRGTGAWGTRSAQPLDQSNSTNQQQEVGEDAPAAYDTNQDPAEPPAETQILESISPNRALIGQSAVGEFAMNQLTLCVTNGNTLTDEERFEHPDDLHESDAWSDLMSSGDGATQFGRDMPATQSGAESSLNAIMARGRPAEPSIQNMMVRRGNAATETSAGLLLSNYLQQMRAEVNGELAEMRASMREMRGGAADVHEILREQQSAFKELQQKMEAQDREQKAQAEHHRLEREIVQLRERMRDEKEARMGDTIRAQELELKGLKGIVEAMACKQRELNERHQQERVATALEMENQLRKMEEEHTATVVQLQEVVCAQESVIQELEAQQKVQAELEDRLRQHCMRAELHIMELHAKNERLQTEDEQAKRHITDLRKELERQSEHAASRRIESERVERYMTDLRKQERSEHEERLRKERDQAECRMMELRKTLEESYKNAERLRMEAERHAKEFYKKLEEKDEDAKHQQMMMERAEREMMELLKHEREERVSYEVGLRKDLERYEREIDAQRRYIAQVGGLRR